MIIFAQTTNQLLKQNLRKFQILSTVFSPQVVYTVPFENRSKFWLLRNPVKKLCASSLLESQNFRVNHKGGVLKIVIDLAWQNPSLG